MAKQAKRGPRERKLKIGDRELVTTGLDASVWRDLSHQAMTVTWPVFIAASAVAFFALNALFALAYLAGSHPLANLQAETFPFFFYFSIETLATVGYGDMHPQTHYGHLVASVESFTGIFCIALMTGLIFARFSRPRARILFANVATVTTHDGQRVFMLRLANERHNLIADARAKVWFVRRTTTLEGRNFRGFVEMPLLRAENPMFMLSWSIMHVIDAQSPLAGLTQEDLERMEAGFVVSVQGTDDNSAQQVHARQTYGFADLRWAHHYVDILQPSSGRIRMDYRKFHDIEPEKLGVAIENVPESATDGMD